MTKIQLSQKRGLLTRYPPNVVAVVNGHPVTTDDILERKRARQQRHLNKIRRGYEPLVKPGFVWVFFNSQFWYYGWHLYVKTLKKSWWISKAMSQEKMAIKLMRLFPCGYLPIQENLRPWMQSFAEAYHWPTQKRSSHQGMVIVDVVFYEDGELVNVRRRQSG